MAVMCPILRPRRGSVLPYRCSFTSLKRDAAAQFGSPSSQSSPSRFAIAAAGVNSFVDPSGSAQIARRKKPKTRSLWAHDNHGRYRTRGQNSVATVRGTTWVTQERCDGTLTRVIHGAVVVKDRHTRGKVVVRAGHRFLARSPKTD